MRRLERDYHNLFWRFSDCDTYRIQNEPKRATATKPENVAVLEGHKVPPATCDLWTVGNLAISINRETTWLQLPKQTKPGLQRGWWGEWLVYWVHLVQEMTGLRGRQMRRNLRLGMTTQCGLLRLRLQPVPTTASDLQTVERATCNVPRKSNNATKWIIK